MRQYTKKINGLIIALSFLSMLGCSTQLKRNTSSVDVANDQTEKVSIENQSADSTGTIEVELTDSSKIEGQVPETGAVKKQTKLSSSEAFQETLFPILKKQCSRCHGDEFASTSAQKSLSVLTSEAYVNLKVPENSKIVKIVRRGHKKISSKIADDMQAAIVNWIEKTK